MKWETEDNKELNNLISVAFQAMMDSTKDMVFVKNANLVYVAASASFVKMVGKENAEEIIGQTDMDIFADENLAKRYIADDRKLISDGINLVDYIEPLTDDEGQHRYGSTSKYILTSGSGEVMGILGITQDITRDYLARQHYQQELKYLFELPADTYAVSYIDVDDWRIISQRRQLIDDNTFQSCLSVERLCEAALESIVDDKCEAAEFYRNFIPIALKAIYGQGRSQLSFQYLRHLSKDTVRWVQNDVRFLTDVDTGHLCVMLSAKDIDVQKREQQELTMAAQLDKMTMLLNRETTMKNIREVLTEEADKQHVLFMFDVDNFKCLNDTFGHQLGDEFLIALARELKTSFRESDIVGRIGGDEFFALMRNVPSALVVEKKAQDLLDMMHGVCADYSDVHLSGSIGIGVYPENGRTLEELYSRADEALYQAKGRGKNQYVFAV